MPWLKKKKKVFGAIICPHCKSRAGMITLFGVSRCVDCNKDN